MLYSLRRCALIFVVAAIAFCCAACQPTKNVWKSTKGLWNEYVSPPASVDYDEKGELPEEARQLTNAMMGIDKELSRLERVMLNADRPPSQQWIDQLFANFPWLDGFAGVKYDGAILGQQPAESLKELDFIPLLYEDKKQNSRALRADVQPTPLGPEVFLAAPLYDGVDFLGIVAAYFDMRSLMRYSADPENLVILTPTALLWPGKFEFTATPLAGVDWANVVVESTSGTCANAHGSFFYLIRYLGNLPIIFATPEKGNFPAGDGSLEQGYAVFPREREKLPPPPLPERKPRNEAATQGFGRSEDESPLPDVDTRAPESAPEVQATPSNEIQPGSRDSMLLRGGGAKKREIQERPLEGENVEVERAPRRTRPVQQRREEPELNLIPDVDVPTLPGGRPSPFGPGATESDQDYKRPSPFGPAHEPAGETQAPPAETPATPESPARSAPGVEPPAEAESPAAEGHDGASSPAQTPAETERPSRPSPFGPPARIAPEAQPPTESASSPDSPSPFGPPAQRPEVAEPAAPADSSTGAETEKPVEPSTQPESNAPQPPAMLPGGRPSPFGPRNP